MKCFVWVLLMIPFIASADRYGDVETAVIVSNVNTKAVLLKILKDATTLDSGVHVDIKEQDLMSLPTNLFDEIKTFVLSEKDLKIRHAAIVALEYCSDPRAFEFLFDLYVAEKNREIKIAEREVLEKIMDMFSRSRGVQNPNSIGRKALKIIQTADENSPEYKFASKVVGWVKYRPALPYFLNRLKLWNGKVNWGTFSFLIAFNRDELVDVLLDPCLEKKNNLCYRMRFRYLLSFGSHKSVRLFLDALSDKNTPSDKRRVYISTLGNIPSYVALRYYYFFLHLIKHSDYNDKNRFLFYSKMQELVQRIGRKELQFAFYDQIQGTSFNPSRDRFCCKYGYLEKNYFPNLTNSSDLLQIEDKDVLHQTIQKIRDKIDHSVLVYDVETKKQLLEIFSKAIKTSKNEGFITSDDLDSQQVLSLPANLFSEIKKILITKTNTPLLAATIRSLEIVPNKENIDLVSHIYLNSKNPKLKEIAYDTLLRLLPNSQYWMVTNPDALGKNILQKISEEKINNVDFSNGLKILEWLRYRPAIPFLLYLLRADENREISAMVAHTLGVMKDRRIIDVVLAKKRNGERHSLYSTRFNYFLLLQSHESIYLLLQALSSNKITQPEKISALSSLELLPTFLLERYYYFFAHLRKTKRYTPKEMELFYIPFARMAPTVGNGNIESSFHKIFNDSLEKKNIKKGQSEVTLRKRD